MLDYTHTYSENEKTIDINFDETDDKIYRISITDPANKIGAMNVSNLFEPLLNSIDLENEGSISTIDLAIANGMMNLMYGKIGFKINPDNGVSFSIDLPVEY